MSVRGGGLFTLVLAAVTAEAGHHPRSSSSMQKFVKLDLDLVHKLPCIPSKGVFTHVNTD